MKYLSILITTVGLIQTSMFYYYGTEILGFYPTNFEFLFLFFGIFVGIFMASNPLIKYIIAELNNAQTKDGE